MTCKEPIPVVIRLAIHGGTVRFFPDYGDGILNPVHPRIGAALLRKGVGIIVAIDGGRETTVNYETPIPIKLERI